MSFTPEPNDDTTTASAARRRFLSGIAAATAGLGLPAGVTVFGLANAKPADEPVSSAVRWGMLIDTTKCAKGCSACVDACEEENGLDDELEGGPATATMWIRKIELRNKNTGQTHSLPMPCQHCENPPCVDVCPTGASFKRADGIVLVDKHICIGCRYCMMACPYKARSFIHEELEHQKTHAPRGKGCVESCTFCVHRVDAGNYTPACVEACNTQGHKAMYFGDLNDPESEVSREVAKQATLQVRSDLGCNPGVHYRGIPT
jgi:molybdopterin-containing oxidoreductase family iron-sulfur binding subunit